MEKRVSKTVFKAKACEFLRHVETLGETVIVTDRGEPTVEIRPYRRPQRSPLDVLRASIVHFNGIDEPAGEVAANGVESGE
ncbi:type II toxin-antitoxin system Phd/YefM family antitoxin [Pararobbsia silviterrae]|uniref:Type II toxin-antitoxin system Phd/YefM family antitoxin n=1 Tax=Pararobbsia silviterrae TaxID=1792498 RepID=A0A494Y8A7_9BURK|nr:type II toxin-antitoxin system Phd/YefM family antitoxin [Pararobbsia silviterrae]RKP58616.1 type II toxin-antitoxin system Phd/YefM family antitoxin [Pararobbsia silviterrae]